MTVGETPGGAAPWQATFLDGAASLAKVSGLPPSYVQVLAWLVVCDPPHQSVDQMQAVLALSSGAVSMATTSLIRMGLVERTAQPGQRRHYYRFRPGGWERMLRLRIEATAQMRAIAEAALAAAPNPHRGWPKCGTSTPGSKSPSRPFWMTSRGVDPGARQTEDSSRFAYC